MKMKVLFPFLLCVLIIAACSPTTSELWLNKDGSGKSVTTIDLTEYFDMLGPMVSSMDMGVDGDSISGEVLSNKMFEEGEDTDSTVVFYDIMPDSIKEILDHPEHMKSIKMHIKTNAAEKVGFLKLIVDFKNTDHFNAIKDELEKSKGDQSDGMMMGSDDEMDNMFEDFQHDLKEKLIVFPETDLSGELDDDPSMSFLYEKLDSLEHYAEGSEQLAMLEMFFGSDMEYIVHAPGKIKSCSVEDADIDGKTVRFKVNLLECLKKGVQDEIRIKYK